MISSVVYSLAYLQFDYNMTVSRAQLIAFLVAAALFLAGFVINLTSDQSLYNADLNLVPEWQSSTFLGSSGFIVFMNIVSMVFDPPVCAAYLLLFWLLSSRRL